MPCYPLKVDPLFVVTIVTPPASPMRCRWPMPNHCHSTTECSVTAYCTAFIHPPTHPHTHTSPHFFSDLKPFPRPGVLTLCYGRLSHHSHIPNVLLVPKALLWSLCGCRCFQNSTAERGQDCVRGLGLHVDSKLSTSIPHQLGRRMLSFPTIWNWENSFM